MFVQQYPLYYVNKAEDPPQFTGTIQYRNREGMNLDITAEKFSKLTSTDKVTVQYTTQSRPSILFKQMLAETNVVVDMQFYSKKFPGATDKNLRLVHMEGENASVGLGVVAARVIKCGEVICHYNGLYVVQDERGSGYQLDDVNAEKFRNLGAMVNHSFPNAKLGGWDHAGFREWVIVAIDDIKEGELVCANYGHDYESLTLGKRFELRYDEAARFVKEADINVDGIGANLLNSDKWHYLACNHSLLLELYFKRDWSWEKIENFLQCVCVCTVGLPNIFSVARQWLTIGIGGLDKGFQKLSEVQPVLYKKIGEYFRHAGRTKSSIGAVYALKMLPGYLREEPLTKALWSELQQKLDPYIEAWEHITSNRIEPGQEFTEETPLHRAFRVICNDPTIEGFSLQ